MLRYRFIVIIYGLYFLRNYFVTLIVIDRVINLLIEEKSEDDIGSSQQLSEDSIQENNYTENNNSEVNGSEVLIDFDGKYKKV